MKPAVIETERLVLDALTPDDADAVYEYCQDDELQRWIPVPQPYTMADAHFFVGPHARAAGAGQTLTIWGIRDSTGLVGLIELRFEPLASATVGFWLGEAHRGKHIMPEALSALVEYAFDPAGLRLTRLHWECGVGNVASAKVARSAGFQFEGVSRGSIVHRSERLDSWEASLLAGDARELAGGWPL